MQRNKSHSGIPNRHCLLRFGAPTDYFLILLQVGPCRDTHIIRIPHIVLRFIGFRHRFTIIFLDKDYLTLQVVGISIGKSQP